MKFAVNFSVNLQRLLQEDHLPVDMIKCPEWDGMVFQAAKLRPVYIHYDILIGSGMVYRLNFEKILALKSLTSTKHINCHLVTTRQSNPTAQTSSAKMVQTWQEELAFLISQVGHETIAVESFPYMPYHPFMKAAVNPELIADIINNTGTSLLLDLAHIRITALNLGIDAKAYIQKLPLDKLVELHITGIKPYQGYLTDHFELQPEDWDLFEWAMHQIHAGIWQEPEYVAFEYGGVGDTFAWRSDRIVLETHIPRLAGLIHKEN